MYVAVVDVAVGWCCCVALSLFVVVRLPLMSLTVAVRYQCLSFAGVVDGVVCVCC